MPWGEQFNMLWRQVDFNREVIDLTKTKNGWPRLVPLNSIALAALVSHRGSKKVKASDPVFPLPGEYADCGWWFDPAIKEAGIDDYTWHNNRRTFCSWCAMAGVSIKEIQELVGHRTIAMSARYSHLSPARTMAATERLVSATATAKRNSHQNSH